MVTSSILSGEERDDLMAQVKHTIEFKKAQSRIHTWYIGVLRKFVPKTSKNEQLGTLKKFKVKYQEESNI